MNLPSHLVFGVFRSNLSIVVRAIALSFTLSRETGRLAQTYRDEITFWCALGCIAALMRADRLKSAGHTMAGGRELWRHPREKRG
jgi:hypothetical protein